MTNKLNSAILDLNLGGKMKKIFLIISIMLVAIIALVGCNKETNSTEPTSNNGNDATNNTDTSDSSNSDLYVGMVTDEGGIDDKSFNQGTYEGIKKYAEEANWTEGQEFDILQSAKKSDYIPNITMFQEKGVNLVITPGYLFAKDVAKAADMFPDLKFALIDTVVEKPNVKSIVFAENEGSFLVGVAAGLSSKTNKVGFIGGDDSETINKFRAGFEQGVLSVNPDAEITTAYIGSFIEPGKGKAQANAMYNEGIDIIFVAAGNTGNGVISEARERAQAGEENIWVIGVDRDQYSEGIYKTADGEEKSIMLTSMVKKVDVASYEAIKELMNDNFQANVVILDLAAEGVGIPNENPNLTKEIMDIIAEYTQKIVNKEITVDTEVK